MRLLLFFLLLPLLGEGYPPPLDEGADPLPEVYPEKRGALSFSTFMPKGEEFQVNEEGYPGGFPQWYPDIVPLSDNGFVVVWMDERNGDYDIYAQRFGGEGKPQGETIRVNDDSGSANQWNPGVASDHQGRWAVVWSDYREGGAEMYGQIFAGDQWVGGNFKLSHGKETERYYPDVAGWGGRFLAVWEDRRDGDPDIYGQLFDSNSLVGENFKLNDPTPKTSQRYPQVASSGEVAFLVVWRDYRKGPAHIFGQFVKGDGRALGGNFWVDDDPLWSVAYNTSVSGDGMGKFVVAWEGWVKDNYDIFARQYDSTGAQIGGILVATKDPSDQFIPAVAAGPEGFLLCWEDWREENYDIYAQRFDREGNLLGENFKANDDLERACQRYQAAAWGKGRFCICWRDMRDGLAQVYAQTWDSSGQSQGSNFKPARKVRGAHQFSPSLASEPEGLTLVAWEDYREGRAKIYGQWINGEGFPIKKNFPIQDRAWSCQQLSPQVASSGEGEFSIVWRESKDGDWDVWLKRLPKIILKVNDHAIGFRGYPSLSYGKDGYLMICWVDWRGGYDIFGQVYDSDLFPMGPNFRLNDEAGDTTYRDHPWVAGARGFVAVWREYSHERSHIYAQAFDSLAHSIGGNFRVGLEGSYQFNPQVAFGRDNEFCVVWVSEEGGDGEIYAQWFDGQGGSLTDPILVNDDGSGATQGNPTVVGHQGEYIIAWNDYREGDGDIYGQKFSGAGLRQRMNFRLNSDPGQKGQLNPSLSSSDTLLLACWEDTRIPGNGYDIWAKLSSWERTDVKGGPAHGLFPNSFSLCQNYPNPFNSATLIRYHLSAVRVQQSAVSLKIYNIRGQETATLVNREQRPGSYEVIWDGRDRWGNLLPSGIYFCLLKVGDLSLSRKMLLVK
jgi:hypothetical protein